jgi:N-acetylneuraminic acid mutarotase
MTHIHRLIGVLAVGLALAGCSQDTTLEPDAASSAGVPTGDGNPPSLAERKASAIDLGPPKSSELSLLSSSTVLAAGPTATSIPYAPEPGPFANPGPSCDICTMTNVPIGFSFTFFGKTYSSVTISTKGFVSFNSFTDAGCCQGGIIPSSDGVNNVIAAAWTDLYPPGGGAISYETRGRAPNRYLVVSYQNLPWYEEYGTNRVTTQIMLFESTNLIEIHTANQSFGHIYTQGVEDATGTLAAFLPGRVSANYGLFNDGVRFSTEVSTSWATRAPLLSARRGFAVGATGALIYTIGGINSAGTVLKTVQTYSAANNSWTTKASLPAARQTGDGAVTINGIIYLPGGHDATNALTKTLYAYNTSTNVWSTKAAMPAFSSCGGSAVISGKIYVYSGCTKSSTGSQIAATALHRYDPVTNTWTTLHAAPVSHFQPVVGAIAGKLYVIGGNNSSSVAFGRVDMYDPATNAWTSKAAMPTARVGAAGSTINGKFQVIGGRNGTTYLNTVEAFDPAANSWVTRPSMPTARAALGVGGLSGFLYAIGGRNSSSVLATNERYTP